MTVAETVESLTAGAGDTGARVDAFVASRLGALSRSAAQRLIDEGQVRLNGRVCRRSERVTVGDRIEVRVPPPRPSDVAAEALPVDIVYEDDDLLVVNKPAGMAVHPSPGHAGGTLVNAVLYHRPDIAGVGGVVRPGIVHRLDKDTSGLVIVAKHDVAHRHLAHQLKDRAVEKTYLALVRGYPEPAQAVIDAPIGRDGRHRQRMAVVPGGRVARTGYTVREWFGEGAALVEAHPETGRTHQIRVHFAVIGHAILGDRVYGEASGLIGRQALHAWRLRFRSPTTGETIAVEALLPEDFAGALRSLHDG